jgi:hypothetical protein
LNVPQWSSRCTSKQSEFSPICVLQQNFECEPKEQPKRLMKAVKSADYTTMSGSKLDSMLNNLRTTLSDVDNRRDPEWDLPTLEHAKARLQWLATDALQAMNLIDELIEQHAED